LHPVKAVAKTVRLHRDLKIAAPGLTRFVNATAQIDDAICDVKINVPACACLQTRRTQLGCGV
jgi:hypothetical protein